jgi:hypothetical protein
VTLDCWKNMYDKISYVHWIDENFEVLIFVKPFSGFSA